MDQNNEPTTPDGTPTDAPETVADTTAVVASNAAPQAEPASNAVALNTPAPVAPSAQPTAPQAHTLQKNFEQVPNAVPGTPAPAAEDAAATPISPSQDPKPPKVVRSASETFRRRSVGILIGGVAACALALGAGGFALGATLAATNAATASTITSLPQTFSAPDSGTGSGSGSGLGSTGGSATLPQQTAPFGSTAPSTGSGTAGTSSTATPATAEQKAGVVTIVSNLYYSDTSQAAGTGVILTSNGQILTNNHVIDGATSIAVTVESTGKTYTAKVVGSDATNDIAVLQLEDASGLTVATTSNTDAAVGDTATSIGNAEGTGNLVAAAGTITALNESITVGNQYSGASESLSNLIQIDADVVSGDSGGPLVNADGEVIGIVTAASSGTENITGFAIPIDDALSIVKQIDTGVASGTVTIGLPAFLGIQLPQASAGVQTTAGVAVGGVIAGTPAATAGLVAGDTITAVGNTPVSTSDALTAVIATYKPGDSVTVTYTTAAGASQTVTVTLTEGPAA